MLLLLLLLMLLLLQLLLSLLSLLLRARKCVSCLEYLWRVLAPAAGVSQLNLHRGESMEIVAGVSLIWLWRSSARAQFQSRPRAPVGWRRQKFQSPICSRRHTDRHRHNEHAD